MAGHRMQHLPLQVAMVRFLLLGISGPGQKSGNMGEVGVVGGGEDVGKGAMGAAEGRMKSVVAVEVEVGCVAVPEVLVVVVVDWAEAVGTNRRAMAPTSILSFTMASGNV